MVDQVYATQTTQYFDDLIAAAQAGGQPANLTGGTLVVGDGNGAVPTISALIGGGGVTHEVWRGQTIQSVTIDPNAANQIDVSVDIPATIGGAEIGPFTVREFAILDATGACCIVGTTNLEKTISSQGQTSDLSWIAAVVVASTAAVTVTPPSAGFATMAQVVAAINGNLPDAQAPITKTDTPLASGFIKRVFGILAATQAALGAGRPATDDEFNAGQPAQGGFPWPWPTLGQVTGALAALANAIANYGTALGHYLPLAGGTMQGALALAGDPIAAAQAATKHYVDVAVAALAGYLPLTGGTMTGFLTLNADPTDNLHAVTKEYVDNLVTSAVNSANASTVFPNVGSMLTTTTTAQQTAPTLANAATLTAAQAATYAISKGAPAGSVWSVSQTGESNVTVLANPGGANPVYYNKDTKYWLIRRTA